MKRIDAMNPKIFKRELEVFIQANDANGFIALCQSIKGQAMALISEDRCIEAKRMMETYSNVLRSYSCNNPRFTLEIMPIMPPNASSTLRLMGKSADIDAYILEHKVDLDVICKVEDGAAYHLIEWAMSNNDLSYAEQVIQRISDHLNDFHSNKESIFSSVSTGLLNSLLRHEDDREVTCTPGMDEAIASLMSDNRGKRPDEDDYYLLIAKAGLSKTLMRALELESFYAFRISTQEKRDAIYSALPENPTAQEMYWIFRSIEFCVDTGIESQILFDERIDINEHIEILRSTYPGQNHFNELGMHTLDRFMHQLEDDVLNTPSKMRRAVAFVDAICEQEANIVGRTRSPEKIRDDLIDRDIPHAIIRQVKMLRGLELEDSLGL